MKSIVIISIVVGFLLLDFMIFLAFGVLEMSYDDSYYEGREKLSYWEGMTSTQKIIEVGFTIWNLVNLVVIGIVAYKLIKYFRKV
jgi:hypothetical protein